MGDVEDFHHYKGMSLESAEQIERRYTELILAANIPDDKHESSTIWELKHSAGCCQIARILAQKRGLDVQTAAVAALLHDIQIGLNGTYADHAVKGAPLAHKMLEEVGGFSAEQIDTIVQAIAEHSQKEVVSENPYAELVKDVDVFDCSLYRGAEKYYRLHKPEPIFKEYVKRIKAVRQELGLPAEPIFWS